LSTDSEKAVVRLWTLYRTS